MWMNVVVNSLLVGTVFAFVVWCVYEAVYQYRWERKMRRMEAAYKGSHKWAWHREGFVWPLFHEQGEDDV